MSTPAGPVPIETLLAHREWVRRVARALVADENAADDVEQDLWIGALTRPPRVKGSVRGWLAAALRHTILNRRRSEVRRQRREEAVSRPERQPSTAEVVATAETHRSVVVEVMRLPEPYRGTVLLRYFQGLSPTAIAEREDMPVETVHTRLRRARETLRDRLTANGDRRDLRFALAPLFGEEAVSAPTAASVAGGLIVNATSKIALAVLLVAALAAVTFLLLRGATGPESVAPPASAMVPPVPESQPLSEVQLTSGIPTLQGSGPPAPPATPVATGDSALVGDVVDAMTGEGIGGATVFLTRSLQRYALSNEVASTDAQGRFSIPDSRAPTSAPVELSARAVGYESATLTVTATSRSAPQHVRLAAGETVSGHVVDDHGVAIGDAEVIASSPANRVSWPVGPLEERSSQSLGGVARSDHMGSFDIRGLTRGRTYSIRAIKSGWASAPLDYPRVDAPASDVTVVLTQEARLVFRFVDARTGLPIDDRPSVSWSSPNGSLADNGHDRTAPNSQSGLWFLIRKPSEALTIPYQTASDLFEQESGTVTLVAGDTVTKVISCRRVDEGLLVDTPFRAVWPSGAPFDGTFGVRLHRVGRRSDGDFAQLTFIQGMSDRPLRLPAGDCEVAPAGTMDIRSIYWRAFGEPVGIHVGGGGVPELVVHGGTCVVKVVDSNGLPVRGCTYNLRRTATTLGMPWSQPTPRDIQEDEVRFLLDPGDWDIVAGLPERGKGKTTVHIADDGSIRDAVVQLVPGPGVDFWKGFRRVSGRR